MGQNTTSIPRKSQVKHIRVQTANQLPQPEIPTIAYITEDREYAIVEYPVGVREYVDMENYQVIEGAPRKEASLVTTEVAATDGNLSQDVSGIDRNITFKLNEGVVLSGINGNSNSGYSIEVADSRGTLISETTTGDSFSFDYTIDDYNRVPEREITISYNSSELGYNYNLTETNGDLYELLEGDPNDLPGLNGEIVEFKQYDFL